MAQLNLTYRSSYKEMFKKDKNGGHRRFFQLSPIFKTSLLP